MPKNTNQSMGRQLVPSEEVLGKVRVLGEVQEVLDILFFSATVQQ